MSEQTNAVRGATAWHPPFYDLVTECWMSKYLDRSNIDMAALKDLEGYDEIVERIISVLPPEEVMRHYKVEERLAGLKPEDYMRHFAAMSPEERAALRRYLDKRHRIPARVENRCEMSRLGSTGMAGTEDQEAIDEIMERILRVLTPAELMRHYKPEERLAGLKLEERLAGLKLEKRAALRKYLDETSS